MKFTKEQADNLSQEDLDSLSEVFIPILSTNSKYLTIFFNLLFKSPFPYSIFDPIIPSHGTMPFF
jgi:hypothetical protein